MARMLPLVGLTVLAGLLGNVAKATAERVL